MIKIKHHSGIYQLYSEQKIKANIDDVWSFFSMPQNLDVLTPPNMSFRITSDEPTEMYQGQIITYSIEILPKVRQNWVTEIKHVVDKKLFVDEQRFGPYAMWHHEHHFQELNTGDVLMHDIVSYKLPLGLSGRLTAGKMIRNRIQQIFEYREKKVDDIFK